MRIRNGFVSNSSGTSFLAYAVRFDGNVGTFCKNWSKTPEGKETLEKFIKEHIGDNVDPEDMNIDDLEVLGEELGFKAFMDYDNDWLFLYIDDAPREAQLHDGGGIINPEEMIRYREEHIPKIEKLEDMFGLRAKLYFIVTRN